MPSIVCIYPSAVSVWEVVGNYCLLSLHSPPWAAQVSLSRLPAGMCIGQTRPTELSGNPEAPLSHLYDMLLAPYLYQPLRSLGGKLDSSLHLWASLLMSLGRCCCVALGTMGTVKLVLYTVYFSRHLPGPVLSAPPAVSSKTYCLSLSDGPCQEWSREL